jgi:hypothetical protein
MAAACETLYQTPHAKNVPAETSGPIRTRARRCPARLEVGWAIDVLHLLAASNSSADRSHSD